MKQNSVNFFTQTTEAVLYSFSSKIMSQLSFDSSVEIISHRNLITGCGRQKVIPQC